MAAASGEPRKLDERQVVEKFKALRSHETSLISKIAELQAELREHECVPCKTTDRLLSVDA